MIQVSGVYYLMLAGIWNPEGLQLVVDRLLHTFVPLYTGVFWLFFSPKKDLRWQSAFRWLLVPLAYFIYAMFVGALIRKYPYPFFDVNEHGVGQVILTGVVLLAVMAMIGLLVIASGKALGKRTG